VSVKDRLAYREVLHLTEREAVLHAHLITGSRAAGAAPLNLDIFSAWQRMCDRNQHQLPVLAERQRVVDRLSERDGLCFLPMDDAQVSYQKLHWQNLISVSGTP
jgi:hypothetical protein